MVFVFPTDLVASLEITGELFMWFDFGTSSLFLLACRCGYQRWSRFWHLIQQRFFAAPWQWQFFCEGYIAIFCIGLRRPLLRKHGEAGWSIDSFSEIIRDHQRSQKADIGKRHTLKVLPSSGQRACISEFGWMPNTGGPQTSAIFRRRRDTPRQDLLRVESVFEAPDPNAEAAAPRLFHKARWLLSIAVYCCLLLSIDHHLFFNNTGAACL